MSHLGGRSVEPGVTLLAHYSPTFNDTTVHADTVCKADHVARLLVGHDAWNVVRPAPASSEELERVHDDEYVSAVRTGVPEELAASNGIGWDDSLFAAAASSTGGIRDAALHALRRGEHSGALASGLHHARAEQGEGFCTFNGLVVAARAALDHGATRVLVLDLDAHCGGGTASLIDGVDGIEQVDVSVIGFDWYPSRSDARLTMSTAETYLVDVEAALSAIPRPDELDLVLYNAGMDPHEHAGGRSGITTATIATREQLVFEWADGAGVPVAFTLAGGYQSTQYDLDGVAALHLLTFDAAAAA